MLDHKTATRMSQWLQENPYTWYGSYNDQLSDTQLDHLVEGNFDSFYDEWHEYTDSVESYAQSDDIEQKFAETFHLHQDKAYWPDPIKDLFHQEFCHDFSDLLDTCIRNTRTKIAVKPVKQSGEYIYFPNAHDLEPAQNRYLQRYNKNYLGIENSWEAETIYHFDALTFLGEIDIREWLKHGRKPDFFQFGPDDYAITHNSWNGSGGLGDVQITKTRKMRAEFRNDATDKYGVDQVFGFVGSVWRNDLKCIWQ